MKRKRKSLALSPISRRKFRSRISSWSLRVRRYALLRSTLKSGDVAGVKQAVDYALKGIKLYPLSAAANPPTTRFVDVLGKVFDGTIPYDLSFYETLNRVVQYEPWLPRDKVMVDLLASIGIKKGKPFVPDATTKKILGEAINETHALLSLRYDTVFESYFEGKRWFVPGQPELVATAASFYETPDTCSASIWMGTQRQSGWPFRRSRREDDCRGPTITQGIFS
jgi:hypothetical protein